MRSLLCDFFMRSNLCALFYATNIIRINIRDKKSIFLFSGMRSIAFTGLAKQSYRAGEDIEEGERKEGRREKKKREEGKEGGMKGGES